MNFFRNLSVGAKLWAGVIAIIVALFVVVATAGARSAPLNEATERVLSALAHKTTIATEWAGLTETNVTRVQASIASSDPAIAEMYKDMIPAGVAAISALQKELQAMDMNEAEKAQMAKNDAECLKELDAATHALA